MQRARSAGVPAVNAGSMKIADWAKPVLLRMAERGILETNATGHFRLKPVSKKKQSKQWVSPDIAKILKESGVEVESAGEESGIGSDEYYDQL